MSISAYETFGLYLALKRHFDLRGTYDFFKYGGKINVSRDKYETRRDVPFFQRIASKYKTREKVIDYLVANFVAKPSAWVGEFKADTFKAWEAKQETFSYSVGEELDRAFFEWSNEGHDFDSLFVPEGHGGPPLFRRFCYGEDSLSVEALLGLNVVVPFQKDFDKSMMYDPLWQERSALMNKYRPFLRMDRASLKRTIRAKVLKNFDPPVETGATGHAK